MYNIIILLYYYYNTIMTCSGGLHATSRLGDIGERTAY